MSKTRTYCSVDGCRNQNFNKSLSFFKLPKEKERRIKWLNIIGRPDLIRDDLRPASHIVCSVHFDKKMIQLTPRLHPDAMPTEHLPSPHSLPSTSTSKIISVISSAMDSPTLKNIAIVNVVSLKKTQTQTSQDSPKRKIHTNLKESDQKRRRLESEIKKIEKEVVSKNTFSFDRFSSENDGVTKRLHKLFEWQSNLNTKRRGNRYDCEFNLVALNMHFSSPQTYRSLRTFLKLPSETALKRFKLNILPKFEDRTLDFLSSKLKSLPDKAKYCMVCVDEMALKRHLHYDTRRDSVVGLHNINGEVTNELASSACVIMLRGIVVNWKQPVAYALLGSAKHFENIETWFDEVISKLMKIGIEVMGIVSDQGSNFDKFAKENKRVTTEKPYFELNGKIIYYMFDVPHLIKCLRNNLLTNDFYHDGKRISWEFIKRLYSNQIVKDLLIPKITDAHINPNKVQKMQVKYAAQVFSLPVVAALKSLIHTKDVSNEAKATVEFLEKINNLFDVLNSSKVISNNKYQTAFAFRKYQIKALENALEMFKNITALSTKTTGKSSSRTANNTNRTKTFKNIQISIKAMLMLCKDLKDFGFNYVFTTRLNQDPLGNFFGAIRQQCGNCRNPTPIQFVRAFSKLFLSNMLQRSPQSNQEDNNICDFSNLLERGNKLSLPIHHRDRPNAQLSELALEGDVDYRLDFPTENGITYVAAYLLFKCTEKHSCPTLNNEMEKLRNLDKTNMFCHFEEYNKSSSFYGALKVPTDLFMNCIYTLETIFLDNFAITLSSRPGSTLYNMIKEKNFTYLCMCFPWEYLLKLYLRFKIFSTITLNNRNLRKGKKLSNHCIKVRPL